MADERLDEMAAIAEMRKELEENGYRFTFTSATARAIAPDGWEYIDIFSSSQPQFFIPMVYAHLTEKRRLEALEAKLERIKQMVDEAILDSFPSKTEILVYFAKRIKEVAESDVSLLK